MKLVLLLWVCFISLAAKADRVDCDLDYYIDPSLESSLDPAADPALDHNLDHHLDHNMVMALRFDEQPVATTFRDSSFTTNFVSATCTGITCPTYAFGAVNASRLFDGTDDVVTVADYTDINFALADFSLSVWVHFRALGTALGIIDKANGGTGYILWTGSKNANRIAFIRGAAKNGEIVPAADHLSTNHWHHLVVVVDTTPANDVATIYSDTVAVLSATIGTNSATAAIAMTLGGTNGTDAGGSGVGRLNGYLDEVIIHNAQLSRGDIQNLYLRGVWNLRWRDAFDDFGRNQLNGNQYWTRSWSWLPMLLG